MHLGQLTYLEAKDVIERGALALWPTGATEAHGPHLPLETDVIIARETCRRALLPIQEQLRLQAVILPPLTLTITDYAAPFSGTLSVPKETALAYVRDGLLSIARQGFSAVCLVNAHLEPAHRFMLRDAVQAARPQSRCPLAIADPADRRWAPRLTEEFRSGACHAGQYESALVMAADPTAVREDLRTTLAPTTVDLMGAMKAGKTDFQQMGAEQAYFGTPAQATVKEGDESYRILADIVVTVLKEHLTPS